MSSSFEKEQGLQQADSSVLAGRQTVQRSSAPVQGAVARIRQLQQTIGNRAVGRLLHPEQTGEVAAPTGEGRPMSPKLRSMFEERFGEDFRKVRIHASEHAAESARALDAVAYTVGTDVVFDAGKFNPNSKQGEHLLAHELAHVVQQSRGGDAPQSFNSGSGLEQEAAQAATQFSSGVGPVSVSGASSAGAARQENADVPLWKRVLNPVYQKALKVLPKPAAEKLEELNETARTLVQAGAVTNEQLNTLVKVAEPIIQPVEHVLENMSTRGSVPPTPSRPVTWIGKPFISVQLEQRKEQKKQLDELKKFDPTATTADLPVVTRPGALSPEEMLGFNPLRPLPDEPLTEFEKKLESGVPFQQTVGSGNLTLRGEDVMQIRDLPTGEIQHYTVRIGASVFVLDREGNVLVSRGLESPLETPVIDPIDVVLFVADVGPLVAKGIAAGGKELASVVARNALRDVEEASVAGTLRRTPAQVSQELMTRYSGRLVDSDNALANIIERARHPSLRVEGRAAATELRGIIDLLEEGVGGKAATRVEVVPSSSAQRTPDVIVHFADGTNTRYEMRTLTSAPRGYVTPKSDIGPGALARALSEDTARRPVSRSQIAQAILDKAKVTATRPSQLTVSIPGVSPGGTISVNVTAATTNPSIIDAAVQGVASRLGPHVERIEVSYLLPRSLPSDALTRGVLTYVRQTNGTYLMLP